MTFRDGRMVSDVRQEKPLDAAAELAALPPAEAAARPEDERRRGCGARARTPRRRRCPSIVYVAMVLGFLGGLGDRASA